jgi:hypothetical protein
MGWHINLVENTVKVTKKVAVDIVRGRPDFVDFYNYINDEGDIVCKGSEPDLVEQVISDGKLIFNSDHLEWMDFLENDQRVVEALKKHKVKGDIIFCSHDGDNKGSAWCHRFDGKGGYELLVSTTKKMTFVSKKPKGKKAA